MLGATTSSGLFFSLCIFVLAFCGVKSLRLLAVRAPSAALLGHRAMLECRFALDGDLLYAVKWYKGGEEFFRYVPAEDPPATIFPLPGVDVDVNESTESRVVLRSVTTESAGRYRCEVSAETTFQTTHGHADLFVVQLPTSGPVIEGGKARYALGDLVDVNCTSRRSYPAANLTWYINGEQAEHHYIREYPTQEDPDGMETSVVGLEFRVKAKHFRKGDLKLKCTATLSALYWHQSHETSAEADRPPSQRAWGIGIFEERSGSGSTKSVTFVPLVVVLLLLSTWAQP